MNKLPLLNWPADPLICTPYPIKPLIDPSSGMLVDLISCWIGWDRVDCGYRCRHRRLWKRALLTLNATFDQVLNLDKCHDPSSCIPYQTQSYDLMGSCSNKTFSRNGSMDADSGLLTLNTTFDEVESDFIEDYQICSIGYIGSCSD